MKKITSLCFILFLLFNYSLNICMFSYNVYVPKEEEPEIFFRKILQFLNWIHIEEIDKKYALSQEELEKESFNFPFVNFNNSEVNLSNESILNFIENIYLKDLEPQTRKEFLDVAYTWINRNNWYEDDLEYHDIEAKSNIILIIQRAISEREELLDPTIKEYANKLKNILEQFCDLYENEDLPNVLSNFFKNSDGEWVSYKLFKDFFQILKNQESLAITKDTIGQSPGKGAIENSCALANIKRVYTVLQSADRGCIGIDKLRYLLLNMFNEVYSKNFQKRECDEIRWENEKRNLCSYLFCKSVEHLNLVPFFVLSYPLYQYHVHVDVHNDYKIDDIERWSKDLYGIYNIDSLREILCLAYIPIVPAIYKAEGDIDQLNEPYSDYVKQLKKEEIQDKNQFSYIKNTLLCNPEQMREYKDKIDESEWTNFFNSEYFKIFCRNNSCNLLINLYNLEHIAQGDLINFFSNEIEEYDYTNRIDKFTIQLLSNQNVSDDCATYLCEWLFENKKIILIKEFISDFLLDKNEKWIREDFIPIFQRLYPDSLINLVNNIEQEIGFYAEHFFNYFENRSFCYLNLASLLSERKHVLQDNNDVMKLLTHLLVDNSYDQKSLYYKFIKNCIYTTPDSLLKYFKSVILCDEHNDNSRGRASYAIQKFFSRDELKELLLHAFANEQFSWFENIFNCVGTIDVLDENGNNKILTQAINQGKLEYFFYFCMEKHVEFEKLYYESKPIFNYIIKKQGVKIEIINYLIDQSAPIDLGKKEDRVLIVSAIDHNNEQLLSFLLCKGANLKKVNYNNKPIFHYVIKHNFDLVEYFIEYEAPVNIRGENSKVLWEDAIRHFDCEHFNSLLLYLIKQGINVNTRLSCNAPVFNYFIEYDSEEILAHLIFKDDLDINCCDVNGVTPLMLAIKKKNKSLIKSILDNESLNINAVDLDGKSVLTYAIKQKNTKLMRFLIKKYHINVVKNDLILYINNIDSEYDHRIVALLNNAIA